MAEQITFTSDPTRDEVSFNSNVDTRIEQKLKGVSNWIITVILSVVFGGIIASMWDLNGDIHTIIGQEAVRNEVTNIRKQKISVLESEIKLLNKKINMSEEKNKTISIESATNNKTIENLMEENNKLKDKITSLKGASK